jgi:hypothetical protein
VISKENLNKNIIKDYTNNPTTIKFDNNLLSSKFESKKGLQINNDIELSVKENPLALKILSTKQIDL